MSTIVFLYINIGELLPEAVGKPGPLVRVLPARPKKGVTLAEIVADKPVTAMVSSKKEKGLVYICEGVSPISFKLAQSIKKGEFIDFVLGQGTLYRSLRKSHYYIAREVHPKEKDNKRYRNINGSFLYLCCRKRKEIFPMHLQLASVFRHNCQGSKRL